MNVPTATRAKHRLPVIEVFGPTIQGEGAEAGLPVHFVRLGGCDFRCSWCDTMYAVDPKQVRENAERMETGAILDRILALGGSPSWVVLSGGNPALHRCEELVSELRDHGFKVAVETQGSIWREWLGFVERLTVSPKPPSSRMATHDHRQALDAFMERALHSNPQAVAIKIVAFDGLDLAWAKRVFRDFPTVPHYLSAGTQMGLTGDELQVAVRDRYRWLAEAVSNDPALKGVRVMPQLHVIAWGQARGV